MKKKNLAIIKWTAVISFLFACVMLVGMQTQAATKEYQEILVKDVGKALKIGAYYFKDSGEALEYSKQKDGSYEEIPAANRFGNVFTNGKKVYYIDKATLCEYNLATKKCKKLYNIPEMGDSGFLVSGVYKNKIFVTRGSFDQWAYWTYVYNIKKKTWRKVMDDCKILQMSGDVVVAQNEYCSDVSPYALTLYKITNKGLKKITQVTDYGNAATFIKNNLYYVEYFKTNLMKVATLCKCNKNGKGVKKIKTFATDDQYGMVVFSKITRKYCDVDFYGSTQKKYRYYYKSTEMKPLPVPNL